MNANDPEMKIVVLHADNELGKHYAVPDNAWRIHMLDDRHPCLLAAEVRFTDGPYLSVTIVNRETKEETTVWIPHFAVVALYDTNGDDDEREIGFL